MNSNAHILKPRAPNTAINGTQIQHGPNRPAWTTVTLRRSSERLICLACVCNSHKKYEKCV
jgi:hypothetical protein